MTATTTDARISKEGDFMPAMAKTVGAYRARIMTPVTCRMMARQMPMTSRGLMAGDDRLAQPALWSRRLF